MFKQRFRSEWMKCLKCGKWRRSYPDFESQWTVIAVEGEPDVYICPSCWGIPDPSLQRCTAKGHDFVQGYCACCGKKQD